MYARVRGDIFKSTMIELTGGLKCSVNFALINKELCLQANTHVLIEKSLPVVECDNDVSTFTAGIGSVINLIDESMEVELRVLGDILTIRQKCFQYDAVKTPEDRMDYSHLLQKATEHFDNIELAGLLMHTRALDGVAKDLGGVKSNINFVNGHAYVRYSNSVLSEPFKSISDVMLPMDAIRALSKFLKGNSSAFKYHKDVESGMMVLQLGNETSAAITMFEPDRRQAVECEKYLSEMKEIARVDFSLYRNVLECICNSYKQLIIEFIVCSNGLRFYVDDTYAKFVAGNGSERICSVKLALSQISAMYKLFGECRDCVISVGGNKICLKQESSKRSLLLAGLIY